MSKKLLYGPANHAWRGGRFVNAQGYMLIRMPQHPRANWCGYVREHILIVEKAIGRYLQLPAEVHHVNEIRTDNRNNNLVVCENGKYHKLLHRRTQAYKATGSAAARKCQYCKQWDHPSNPDLDISTRSDYHRSCRAKYEKWRRERQLRRMETHA